MSIENDQTIEVYEKYGAKYLARNAEALKDNPQAKKDDEWQRGLISSFVDGLSKDARIFEVGSAGGRDAKFMRELGYKNITVSDAANYFLPLLEKEGFSPIKFNLIKDEFKDKYDFILCWAVLVHFTKREAKDAIKKMFDALDEHGRIALCVKHKDGHEEEWEDFRGMIGAKRFFSYWDKAELEDFMKESGFKNITVHQRGGARACWLECFAKK